MKIVVLDGFAENPGDLSWGGLEALGALTVYDRTDRAETHGQQQGGFHVLFDGQIDEQAADDPHHDHFGIQFQDISVQEFHGSYTPFFVFQSYSLG